MQAVIPHLVESGHAVRGIDNFVRYGRIDRIRDYEFIEGDLTDLAFVQRVLNDVDGIIQAAARIYGVGGFHKYPADILSHDLTLHQNVLWTAVRMRIPKVCYISSSMVYERCDRHPSREEDAFESKIPATDYGLCKLVGERLCRAFATQYGLKFVIWRPFNIITPYEKGESEQGISHVFADFIKTIILDRQNPVPIFGDGKQIRCFTWIQDVARTIARWSFDPKTDNQTYNVGNPEPTSMMDLANLIFQEAKSQNLLPNTERPLSFRTTGQFTDDVVIRIPDVSKATRDLGWKPSIQVREAVRRCVADLPRD